jgi:hypothetical protein
MVYKQIILSWNHISYIYINICAQPHCIPKIWWIISCPPNAGSFVRENPSINGMNWGYPYFTKCPNIYICIIYDINNYIYILFTHTSYTCTRCFLCLYIYTYTVQYAYISIQLFHVHAGNVYIHIHCVFPNIFCACM